ncbi:AMP-binding protein [Achromobacter sp. NPDC058515]|uniref:AMP-binding protein n=1 Tax=Achromobacter sp. NPDC058515 TaxID=3346533 RepID=UPI0036686629
MACLIYTPGSTGLPKGVVVAHGPLHMQCEARCRLYEMDADTRELHFLSMAFDAATSGGSARCCAAAARSCATTPCGHRRRPAGRCTAAALSTPVFRRPTCSSLPNGKPPSMRLVSFGGEAIPLATFELVKRALWAAVTSRSKCRATASSRPTSSRTRGVA